MVFYPGELTCYTSLVPVLTSFSVFVLQAKERQGIMMSYFKNSPPTPHLSVSIVTLDLVSDVKLMDFDKMPLLWTSVVTYYITARSFFKDLRQIWRSSSWLGSQGIDLHQKLLESFGTATGKDQRGWGLLPPCLFTKFSKLTGFNIFFHHWIWWYLYNFDLKPIIIICELWFPKLLISVLLPVNPVHRWG